MLLTNNYIYFLSISTNTYHYKIWQTNKKDDSAVMSVNVPSTSNNNSGVSSNPSTANINSTIISTPNCLPNNDDANGKAKDKNEIPNLTQYSNFPVSLQPNTLTSQFQKFNQPPQGTNKKPFTLKVQQSSVECSIRFCFFFVGSYSHDNTIQSTLMMQL